jgi:sec-independent protein translocase protein TatC
LALVPFPGQHAVAPALPHEEEEAPGGQMSFLEHLDELRRRIIHAVAAIALGVLAGFAFINPLVDFLLAPTRRLLQPGSRLIYTQPGEAFSLYVQVALIAGTVLAAPYVMYQVWLFIAPGLYANEKKRCSITTSCSRG